jgi:RND family efflux transporter MFP subunit
MLPMKPHAITTSLALILLAGCGRHSAPISPAAASLPSVKARVATVRSENVPALAEITGTVRPTQRAQIATKIMGTIDEMPVVLGQRVRRGDLLAKISAAEISARLTQAQSQFNATRRDLERERGLLAKGASTADEVRGLEDRFAATQAMVREAQVMLGYITIRAPFDATIARKLANAGDLASPGSPLLELEGTAGFEVEAGVPDSIAAALTVGTSMAVEIPAAKITTSGRIAEVSSSADTSARSVTVKLALPVDERLRSGQFARVQIPGVAQPTLLAPMAAVSVSGQMERVFVAANNNRTALRLVKTGARRNDQIEILSGLDDGERVVLNPPAGLREGQPLEVQP